MSIGEFEHAQSRYQARQVRQVPIDVGDVPSFILEVNIQTMMTLLCWLENI